MSCQQRDYELREQLHYIKCAVISQQCFIALQLQVYYICSNFTEYTIHLLLVPVNAVFPMPLYDPMAREQLLRAVTPVPKNIRRASLDSSLHHGLVVTPKLVRKHRNSIATGTNNLSNNNLQTRKRSLTPSQWLHNVFYEKTNRKDSSGSAQNKSISSKSLQHEQLSTKEHAINSNKDIVRKSTQFLQAPERDYQEKLPEMYIGLPSSISRSTSQAIHEDDELLKPEHAQKNKQIHSSHSSCG